MRSTLATALLAATCFAMPAAAAETPAIHLMKMPGHAAPRAAGTLLYFGGPVISTVKIVAVMWGPNVAPATVNGIGPFLSSLANSSFADLLAQHYSTVGAVAQNGQPGTGQTITRGSLSAVVAISPKNAATALTNKQVIKELRGQIAAKKLPAADLNTLYMVYFPPGISITIGSATSCSSFGAYHEAASAKVTPGNLFFGVMPDCGGGFNRVTYVSSHEFAEAVSDAIPTPGSRPKYPQAWNTANGYEVGDLCEGGTSTTLTAGSTTYAVTPIWNNSANACSVGPFQSP